MFAPDDGAWHRADHFERHGGRDRHWRRILQRPRLRRLAWTGAQADLDGRPQSTWNVMGSNPGSKPPRSGWHPNVLAIALANKLARIAWAVLAKGRAFELTRTDDAGVRPA